MHVRRVESGGFKAHAKAIEGKRINGLGGLRESGSHFDLLVLVAVEVVINAAIEVKEELQW